MANNNNSSSRKRQSALKNNAKRRKIVASSSSTNEASDSETFTTQVNKNQPDQLVTFLNYGILPLELRHHVLTYSPLETLKNYAEVSSLCNEEVRRFNVISPQLLEYRKTENKVEIELVYKNSSIIKNIASENDAGKTEIVKWIKEMYKYVRDHGTKMVSILSRDWPDYILDMKYFNQVNHLIVVYGRRLTAKIMEYIEKWPLTKLELLENEETRDRPNHEVVPRRFFEETNLNKITEMILIAPSCNIDNDQFLALESSQLTISPLVVTVPMIEAKIATLNLDTCKCEELYVKLTNYRLFMTNEYNFILDQPPHDTGLRDLYWKEKTGIIRWISARHSD